MKPNLSARWVMLGAVLVVAAACTAPGDPDGGRHVDASLDAFRIDAERDAGLDADDVSERDAGWPLEDELRGVRFDPETPAGDGLDPWLARYDEPDVRAAVIQELRSVRRVAGLTLVTLVLTQVVHFAWPVPTAAQLDHIVAFVDDANREGVRVALLISHPCIVPNSVIELAVPPVGPNQQHVGGHSEGDIVNGEPVYWDVPRCEDTHVEDAIVWWDAILDALEARAIPDGLAYVAHAGVPTRAYLTEMNLLHNNYRFLETVLAYLGRVIPAMRAHGIPIGISAIPTRVATDPSLRYAFLENLQRAVPIEEIDVIDMTSWVDARTPGYGSIDPDEIIARVGAANAQRIVLSDFNFRDTMARPEDAAARQITTVHDYGFRGYWIWQYKRNSGLDGIRETGFTNIDETGWHPQILDLLQADAAR